MRPRAPFCGTAMVSLSDVLLHAGERLNHHKICGRVSSLKTKPSCFS
uniref:Uncharacterized protein n=1 Tax=Anguilla anguilla TaxID=7936 RepID=A0A0E9VLL1_ANGAN